VEFAKLLNFQICLPPFGRPLTNKTYPFSVKYNSDAVCKRSCRLAGCEKKLARLLLVEVGFMRRDPVGGVGVVPQNAISLHFEKF
jgi:hypothetical protein